MRFSFKRWTRRRYSSGVIWASHWKGVKGLGTKKAVERLMESPRFLLEAWSRQVWMIFPTRSAMASTSSSVSVGRPSIK